MPIACIHSPIIIMGMARSGTTMLAELLAELGLYLGGTHVQEDLEAYYFFRANRKLFLQIHGYSDNPSPMRYFYRNQEAVEATARSLEADVRSWRIAKFIGWQRLLKYRSLARFDQPWGWKDPRNVFTLPLWHKVFPNAKVIYILRNGVDVAGSLRVMEQRDIRRRQSQSRRLSAFFKGKSALERVGFRGAVRHLYLDGGFSLWEEYVEQAEAVLASLDKNKFIIRYEDFLMDPARHLSALHHLCELDRGSEKLIDHLASRVKRNRAYAFQNDAELTTFYTTVAHTPWMTRLGYSDIPTHS